MSQQTDRQELFNAAAMRIIEQGTLCVDDSTPELSPCYRNAKGHFCIIGIVMPKRVLDRAATSKRNYDKISDLATLKSPALRSWFDRYGRDFLNDLQLRHDYVVNDVTSPEEVPYELNSKQALLALLSELQEMADEWSLDTSVLDRLAVQLA
jgi:hypothetical protein